MTLVRNEFQGYLAGCYNWFKPRKAQHVLVWSKHEVTPTKFSNFLLICGLGPDFKGPICGIDENYRSRKFKGSYNSSISYTFLDHRHTLDADASLAEADTSETNWTFLFYLLVGPTWSSILVDGSYPSFLLSWATKNPWWYSPLVDLGLFFGHLNEPKQVLSWCLFCRIFCHF